MVKILRYNADMERLWDKFVQKAKNSTLLHLRGYMDYHADRFKDASLIFTDKNERIIALLPACHSRKNDQIIVSHEGLTYGSYIFAPLTHVKIMEEIVLSSLDYYRSLLGATEIIIKSIPYIYSTQANDEQLYLIHRLGGQLTERNLSQAINMTTPLHWSELRRRNLVKAHKQALRFIVGESEQEWYDFHNLLSEVLKEHHNTQPIHTADELWLLHTRFPDKILLYTAKDKANLLAGAVIYLSPNVAHTQYLAASHEGRKCGALDFVISRALMETNISQCSWFDFGISTERDGSLNYGLTLQKEGFGGRGVCYDTYKITL